MKTKKPLPRRPGGDLYESDFDSFDEFLSFSTDQMIGGASVLWLLCYRPTHEVIEVLKSVDNRTLLHAFYDLSDELIGKLTLHLSAEEMQVFEECLAKMSPPSVEDHASALKTLMLKIEEMKEPTAA